MTFRGRQRQEQCILRSVLSAECASCCDALALVVLREGLVDGHADRFRDSALDTGVSAVSVDGERDCCLRDSELPGDAALVSAKENELGFDFSGIHGF